MIRAMYACHLVPGAFKKIVTAKLSLATSILERVPPSYTIAVLQQYRYSYTAAIIYM